MYVSVQERLVNWFVRLAAFLLLKLDTAGFETIPRRGPGIVLSNHTTNIEGPLLYVLLRPRKATALGKQELWDNAVTRFFAAAWELIPLSRTGVDRAAITKALEALNAGYYLGVAPEGTRSRTGQLGEGHPGAALLATRSEVPIYPVVHWGLRDFGGNVKRGKRTPVTIRVGQPFRIRLPEDRTPTGKDYRRITEEMMYQLAMYLPERHRGRYGDMSRKTTDYIHYDSEG